LQGIMSLFQKILTKHGTKSIARNFSDSLKTRLGLLNSMVRRKNYQFIRPARPGGRLIKSAVP
jgi:hypothetical protein